MRLAYTVYSICVAHANDRATTGQSVRVAGAMLMSYGTGAAFGPVVAGASMSALGPAGLFWQSALVTGALGIYTIYRLLVRPERPVNRPFVPMPAARYTSKNWSTRCVKTRQLDAMRLRKTPLRNAIPALR